MAFCLQVQKIFDEMKLNYRQQKVDAGNVIRTFMQLAEDVLVDKIEVRKKDTRLDGKNI